VVNSALRISLEEISKPAPAKPYKTKPHPLGLKDGFAYDNIFELLAHAEGEDHNRDDR
jgi:hypothetical protein